MLPILICLLGLFGPHETNTVSSCQADHSIPVYMTWKNFLRKLPEEKGPVKDYTGKMIPDQSKHFSIIKYDVGNKDLQQCADALIRIRAEYLFAENRLNQIVFHFVSGHVYRYQDYLKGLRPKSKGNTVTFYNTAVCENTHAALRFYLDIVYTYASTISLAGELKPATGFDIGTVIITPGSPGHCCIITDQKFNSNGEVVYKLVEGYMPAQSIYVLKATDGTEWHKLDRSIIETASYRFTKFDLKTFE